MAPAQAAPWARTVGDEHRTGPSHHGRTRADALRARYRQRSLWLDELSDDLAPRPALEGEVHCDVAIVGAGFTGLWTAYYLKQHSAKLDIAIIEREIAGFGPSGRNGGWVSAGLAGSAAIYERDSTRGDVTRALRETYRAVAEIGSVIAKENIDCGFRQRGAITVATSRPQLQRVRDHVMSQRQLGASEEDEQLLGPSEVLSYLRIHGAIGGSFTPHCARVDPARLVRGLAVACERAGVRLYEQTPALRIEPGMIRTPAGTLSADIVLRATESYTTALPGHSRSYLPLYSLMIATAPLPTDAWRELEWEDGLTVRDRHHLFFYAQRTPSGRIAIGGRGAPYRLRQPIREAHERDDGVKRRLQRALEQALPTIGNAEITHQWGGPLAVPRDWSMSITFDRARGFGWAGGYSGHGVVASNIAGRTLAAAVVCRESELLSLPWVNHRSRSWEPEPLRWVASQAIVRTLAAADRYEDRHDRSARRTKLLTPFLPP
jgi:glycine/D-amino acid oxidase-like deaminating enzyme